MPGIDINRFVDLDKNLSEHLSCDICLNIFDNPVNSRCRHSFCRDCVKQWIDSNHSDCPKCKTQFSKKRRNDDNNDENSILIGNYVFGRDLSVNLIISVLKIKCDFHYNGCQEVIKFGSLESHLKNCLHILCKSCELPAQPLTKHNCNELLKNEFKEFKEKTNKSMALMQSENQRLQNLYNNLVSLSVSRFNNNPNNPANNHLINVCLVMKLFFGTYLCNPRALELTPDGIRAVSLRPKTKAKFNTILIPFVEISEILYSSNDLLPVLLIKPNPVSGLKIQESLNLGHNSQNGLKFDINSEDEKHRYIMVKLERKYHQFIKSVVKSCRRVDNQINCRELDFETTLQMTQRVETIPQTNNI